ncbi:MAG TPA: AraC family transcriptional regulator [Spirochaetota bacterium]|nr:AraC family transcriptional regulator [Spirochaetota bacterium]
MKRESVMHDECVMRNISTSSGDFTLLRASYSAQRFARHSHEELPVGVIGSGSLGFRYRGGEIAAHRGMISIANPDDPHNGYALDGRGWSYRMFYLSPALVRSAAEEVCGRGITVPLFREGAIHDDRLASRLLSLHRRFESSCAPDIGAEETLLDVLRDLIASHSTDKTADRKSGRERAMVRKVTEYIRANAARSITLGELSDLAGLSPFYLSRSFHDATGLPPSEYLTQIRVRRARTLLAGDSSLAQIALAVGFSDQSHFTRRFRSIEGITPAAYRKIIQDRTYSPE